MSRARVLLPILLSLLLGVFCFGAALTSATPAHAVAAGRNALRFFDPVSVAVDRSGNVYLFQRGTSHIHKFSPQGQPLATWQVRTARTFPGPGRQRLNLVTQSITVWGGCPASEPPAPALPARVGDRGIK